MSKTCLQALCEVNKTQGGTIHQYVDITKPNYFKFEELLKNYLVKSNWIEKQFIYNIAKAAGYEGLKF